MLPKLFVGPWSFLRVSSHGGARLAAVASLVGGGVVAVLAPRVIRTPDGGGSRGTGAPVMVAGDTQVVYGPHVFSTPNGRPTNYVEALSLVVQPTRRYTLRLVNGAADGTQRATSGSLSLNGKLLFQGPDFSSGATLTRVVEPLSADTLLVTVEGPAGAFVTVSIPGDHDHEPVTGPDHAGHAGDRGGERAGPDGHERGGERPGGEHDRECVQSERPAGRGGPKHPAHRGDGCRRALDRFGPHGDPRHAAARPHGHQSCQ